MRAKISDSLILLVILVASLVLVIANRLPMSLSFIATSLFTYWLMRYRGAPLKQTPARIKQGLLRILPVIYVLGSIGMMIAIWMHSGTLAACIDLGLKLLPQVNIVFASYLLTLVISMLLGTAVGTIGTVGIMLVALAKAFAIPVDLVTGAIISGSYFGDRTSPMSSSANLTASVSEITLDKHVRHIFKIALPAVLISGLIYLLLGWQYAPTTQIISGVNQRRALLQTAFSINWQHFIPVIILVFVIVILKKHILVAIYSSIASAIGIALLSGHAISDITKTMLLGYYPSASHIAELFQGSGLISMIPIFIVISAASILNSLFDEFGVFDPLLNRFDSQLKTPGKLVLGSGLIAFLVMLITGNQSLPAIVAANRYRAAYDKLNVDKKWLASAISDFMIILVAIPPWNINALLVLSIIGIASISYSKYAVLTFLLPLTSLIITLYALKKAKR